MALRIALDYRPALLSRAGIGRAVRELARALARRRSLDVRLYAHSLARAVVQDEPPPQARLHRLPIPGRSLRLLRKLGLGADHLSGSPQVFHWTDYVELPVRHAAVALTIHDLAFLRDPSWHGDDARTLAEHTRAAAQAARVVIVPSQATAHDVLQLLPEAPPPIVIPFGADHVPKVRLDGAPGDPYLLCVGTIEPRKNHLGLLAALRMLPSPRPRLVLVGKKGWACAAIVDEIRRAEQDGLVEWIQDADDRRSFALMQHATALVCPSHWEGFGFPPLEAMAMGTPVVANGCAPLRELAGDAAEFADATQPAALCEAIARLLRDEDRRLELRRLGLQRAALFSWDECAARHETAYRQALQP